ncbi:AraC family transcriptional regulator [Pseudomonas sp. LS-2]|nr:AraC family transcriptional regulator [Pseudomonas sp. LS-2]
MNAGECLKPFVAYAALDRKTFAGSHGSTPAPGFSHLSEVETGYADDLRSTVDARGQRPIHENLAPWRVKKAKTLMIAFMAHGCSIQRIADECAVSRSHFSRAFKNATGLAPHVWFRREQMRRAETLLRARHFSICRVAQECGFSDQSYFTRVFTRLKGISPRRWQLQGYVPAHSGRVNDPDSLSPPFG